MFLHLPITLYENINGERIYFLPFNIETCFKAFKSSILRNINITSKGFGIEIELTAKIAKLMGVRVVEVPISFYGRSYEVGQKIPTINGYSGNNPRNYNLWNPEAKDIKNSLKEWKSSMNIEGNICLIQHEIIR